VVRAELAAANISLAAATATAAATANAEQPPQEVPAGQDDVDYELRGKCPNGLARPLILISF